MHKISLRRLLLFTAALCVLQPAAPSAQVRRADSDARLRRPKLILQITVDQLRGDEPFRYYERFGEGGFRYLLNRGTWYIAAYHPHSYTVTSVGHTTLATGAYPSRHGIIADHWYDRGSGELEESFEDAKYPIIGTTTPGISPDNAGASPRRIQTTTFSDELTMTTGRRAKVFAVSSKDRAAVPMAGHAGKAFWFSTRKGDFVSSTYYYDAYPAWVTSWNQQKRADAYLNKTWNLLYPRPTYLFRDYTVFAPDVAGYGSTFPHNFGDLSSGYYAKLMVSPFADKLTLEFASELIRQEQLGADDIPDYLGISFSATDTIGHTFGPSSLESEDNLLRLDRTLAELFAFVEKNVGLENTLVVLAGDHGAPEVPEYLEQLRVNTGRIEQKLIRDTAAEALKSLYNRDDLIQTYEHPYFYLSHAAIEKAKLSEAEVERAVARAVMGIKGIAAAVALSDLKEGRVYVDAEMSERILRSIYPNRSGDVYVVEETQWQVQDTPPSGENFSIIDHGTPWAHDAYVPIVFAGANVPAAQIPRRVFTVDVAATLAAYVRTNTPSGSVGQPLVEVFDSRRRVGSTPRTEPGARRR